MRLTSFEASEVHGYLNFNVEFFPGVTFLIGINGSGKTTVLKLILGLTSPSFLYLSQISFTKCRVTLHNDDKGGYTIIEATQKEGKLYISLFNREHDITSKGIRIKSYKENLKFEEKNESEEFELSEVTKLIKELSTPKFLGLDRRVHEGSLIDIDSYKKYKHLYRYRDEMLYGGSESKRILDELMVFQSLDISLSEVQRLVSAYLSKVSSSQILLSEEFRQKIFQEVFKFADTTDTTGMAKHLDNIDRIKQQRQVVNLAIKELGLHYLTESVNAFFERMEELLSEYKSLTNEDSIDQPNIDQLQSMIKWIYNSNKLYQIDEIIKFSQQYQLQVNNLREPFVRLESIITNFLKEGNKSLVVLNNGTIKVELKNGEKADISNLSSGEKQIIIMIAHLIFEEDQKPSGIFIIDEPELSLHIAWQEIFVNSIMEASPKTQFVLATHSPSIVARSSMQKFCQDLSLSNA